MNLANMLLARGAARRKEMAIRLAVGASRFRLMRQMMTEGVVIAMLGGVAGLMLAYWLSVFFARRSGCRRPCRRISAYSFGLACSSFSRWYSRSLCGIGFSLAPGSAGDESRAVAPTLKEGAAIQLRGYRRFGMRNLLVVGQVAGSLMLLLITGFLVMGISQDKHRPNQVRREHDVSALH